MLLRPLTRIIVLLSLLASPAALHAQEGGASSPYPTYVFSTLYWDGQMAFHYTDIVPRSRLTQDPSLGQNLRQEPKPGDAFVYVNKSTLSGRNFRSSPQRYSGPATIQFFDAPPKTKLVEQEDGTMELTTEPEPVAAVTLPSPDKRWLLLFSRQEQPTAEGHQYKVMVLDDSASSFPMGSYRFINMLDRRVGVKMGSADGFFLQPRRMRLIDPAMDERGHLPVKFFDARISREKPAYSSIWYHEPTMRLMVFVREGGGRRGYLDVMSIPETESQLERSPR
jgi:hypothetical protein